MSKSLSHSDSTARRVEVLVALARAGLPLPREDWPESDSLEAMVGATREVSRVSGAPLALSLERCAQVCHQVSELHRRIQAGVAGPRFARRIVLALPAFSVVLAAALGFDVLRVLFTTFFGWVLAGAALALTWLGAWWSRRLIARARQWDVSPGLYPRLLAVAMTSGLGLSRARDVVIAAISARESILRLNLAEVDQVEELVAASSIMGIPLRGLLQGMDALAVAEAFGRATVRAGELGEKLLLPLGVCILPAFVCVGVVPAVISVVSVTASSF